MPQRPRLIHQALAREPAPDLQPLLERLVTAQRRQNLWLAVIALLLAALLGATLH